MPYQVRRPSETRRANVSPTKTAPARRGTKAPPLPAVLMNFLGANKSKKAKLVAEKVAAAKIAAAKESAAKESPKDGGGKKK